MNPMVSPPKPAFGPTTSAALDALRIVAALVVVVFHASSQWTTAYPALHAALGKAAHAAVVLFFVISGYVIAATTARNNRGPRQYALARLSRLYSGLVPALVVTALVEWLIGTADAAVAARYVREYSGARYLLSLFFGNEVGPLSAAPPLNSPLWSLSYEFWYYALFGIWTYRRLTRWGWLWLVLAAVVAGPKILLLLPVWLFGVGAHRRPAPAMSAAHGWLLVGLLLALGGMAAAALPALPAAVGTRPLFFSGQFVTDWVVGALFAGAIWGLPAGTVSGPRRWAKPLRLVADASFPLYVLHFPLLVLWRVLFGQQLNNLQQLGWVILGVTLLAGAAGLLLERQRSSWVRLFDWLIRRFTKKPAPGGPGVPKA
ncbi:acyltransferase [Hymenobacter sp.]|uniref:acyltransferase family protein n=1 Tax=Hymenobacter sp. TaxID=1898978 RepID=UPI002869FC38|nr:acyltransferase [Hymenobacter sp.]